MRKPNCFDPSPRRFTIQFRAWCGRRESNPYDRGRGILSPLRLPVSPRPLAAMGFNGASNGRQAPFWPPRCKAGPTSSALARPGDRRLITQAKVPREIDPGVLRNLGNEGIDEGPPQRLGIDRRAGIGQIVDNEKPFPPHAAATMPEKRPAAESVRRAPAHRDETDPRR